MARGEGAVMAWGRIWSGGSQDSIPCPICGEDMVWEDVAWFCRSGEMRSSGTREPCRPPDEAVDRFYTAPRGAGAYLDGFQFFAEPHSGDPAVHAGLYWDGRWIARAQYIRGRGGCTNFTVQPVLSIDIGIDEMSQQVVEAFRQGAKWTMAPWFEEE